MRRFAALVLAAAIGGFALTAAAQGFTQPSAPGRVFFRNLKNGQTVPTTVKVEFGVEGLKVRPAGEDTEDRASGHHHLIIDGGPIEAGTVIPADARHLHYGNGQTEAEVTLPPGAHTLTMEFADGAHRSYGPRWAATISVHVAPATTRWTPSVTSPTAPSTALVDCLLPSEIRRLGGGLTVLAPRQAVKMSPRDCESRGGQHVSSGNAAPDVTAGPPAASGDRGD
jgi:hypothetical protein